ncbi:hypothetical protein APICC_08292 [Apis cerana cerana]|uniref:Uncharacterized protein n=1 Tax=Apis cerana cerana TaxID=94128 RepID=A0A2A3E9V1_APICC|nr:hypothetical protein APICC_08292 [Apis cerana cerana]
MILEPEVPIRRSYPLPLKFLRPQVFTAGILRAEVFSCVNSRDIASREYTTLVSRLK